MQAASLVAFCLLAISQTYLVTAHGVITTVQGANGKTGKAFGVVDSTPRDGTRQNPFQVDSSIIRDREIASGKASACGRTLAGGKITMESAMAQAASGGLPNVGDDGKVRMQMHQVNGDGAGPYTCEIDATASGNNFQSMAIETNVPGRNSRSRAKATAFPLVATMPPGTTCSGGPDSDACLVRCRNAAGAGPFGGCVLVTKN